jgi:hypothetical protein
VCPGLLHAFVVILQQKLLFLLVKGQGPREIQMQFKSVLVSIAICIQKEIISEAFLSEFQLEI